MWQRIIRTDSTSVGALLLRVFLGIVIFPHGAQKLLGWFGGHGFSGSIGSLTQGAGLPWIVALLVILIESVGAVLLLMGFLTRLAAAGIMAVMLGAMFKLHLANGFFMNWTGQQGGEGFEFHLIAIGMSVALLIMGGGKASVDSVLQRRTLYQEMT